MSTVYQPGVCNIGAAEIRVRRRVGIVGLTITVLLLGAFVVFTVPDLWRLVILVPAGAAAIGLLQAGLRFCTHLGMAGLFNFSDDIRSHETVHEQEYRRKDQRKALLIIGLSIVISIAVYGIAILLP